MARRSAAAVPASKAVIGVTYAVMRNGKLTRFNVSRITTHRIANNGSPHDYESEITGHYIIPDQATTEKATIEPRQLLGRFEEYAELAAQRKREEDEREAKRKHRKAQAERLVCLLYDITDIARPNEDYHAPFRSSFGSEVNIQSADAIDKLVAALEGRGKCK